MLYKIVKVFFSDLFGTCKPVVLNDYETHLQIKYELKATDVQDFYRGLEKLKQRCQKSGFAVRVFVVYPGSLQVILGDQEVVSKLGEDDFWIQVC
mgnify:CR=1 FL=1